MPVGAGSIKRAASKAATEETAEIRQETAKQTQALSKGTKPDQNAETAKPQPVAEAAGNVAVHLTEDMPVYLL